MLFLWDKSQAIPLPNGNFGGKAIRNKDKIVIGSKVIRTNVEYDVIILISANYNIAYPQELYFS